MRGWAIYIVIRLGVHLAPCGSPQLGDVVCVKGIGLSCSAQTRGHWDCNIKIHTLISALVTEI